MAEDTKAEEIVEEVDWLENDPVGSEMRREMRDRWELTMLQKDSPMPDHVERGNPVQINSPRIIDLSRSQSADILSYETRTQVIAHVPSDANRTTYENKADVIEPAFVLNRARLDDGLRISRDVVRHLLTSSYVGVLFECQPEGKTGPRYRLTVPSPDTLFFLEQRMPCVPNELGRHYKMTIRDIIREYGNQTRTKFAGAKLGLKKTGQWDWHGELSADVAADYWSGGTGNKRNQEADIRVLYRDGWCYHVVMDLDSDGKAAKTGTVIWSCPSMTGGVPVCLLSGDVTGYRGTEGLRPFLYPIMQTMKIRNQINSLIATVSQGGNPDALVTQAPEVMDQLKRDGAIRPATQQEITENGPRIVNVPGEKVWFWDKTPNEALERLMVRIENEEHEYIQKVEAISEREVAEQSTASTVLHIAGNIEIQRNLLLKDKDWMWSEIGYMTAITCTGYDPRTYDPNWSEAEKRRNYLLKGDAKPYGSAYSYYAREGERTSKSELEGGGAYGLDGKKMDFGFEIITTTQNVTDAKRDQLTTNQSKLVAMGVDTPESMFVAMGVANIQEHKRKLAGVEAKRAAAGAHQGLAIFAADQAIMLSAGINVSQLKAMQVAQMAPPVAAGGDGTVRMESPVVEPSATGGSVAGT